MTRLREIIERAWDDRSLLDSEETRESINQVVELLDKGENTLFAEPPENGDGWKRMEKKALFYFSTQEMKTKKSGIDSTTNSVKKRLCQLGCHCCSNKPCTLRLFIQR